MTGNPRQPELSDRITRTLRALRRSIRAFVLAHGMALVVVWLAVSFWADLAIDRFFEPARDVRIVLLMVVGGGAAWIAYRRILRLLFVRMSDQSMALVLERRHKEFGESLLTAVHLCDAEPGTDVGHPDMLARTCRVATEQIEHVRLASIFNWKPLYQSLTAAILLATSILGFNLAYPDAYAVWCRRAIGLSEELWPRKAHLVVDGFEGRVVKVARGTDCEIVVLADLRRPLVPEVVRVRARSVDGRLAPVTMTREGMADRSTDRYQRFTHTFRGVLNPITFEIVGGDVVIEGLRIEVVDSPILTETSLDVVYPDYMGRAPASLPVTGVMAIPEGAHVTVRATANKRLASVLIDRENEYVRIEHPLAERFTSLLERQQRLVEFGDSPAAEADQRAMIYEVERFADAMAEDQGLERLSSATQSMRAACEAFTRARRDFLIERLKRSVAKLKPEVQSSGEASEPTWREALEGVKRRVAELEATDKALVAARDYQQRALGELLRADPTVRNMLSMREFQYEVGRISEDVLLRMSLSDCDGIESRSPIGLTIARIEDHVPEVSSRLRGIATAITPKARLPVELSVTDDHGIAEIWFEYAVDTAESVSRVIDSRNDNATEVEFEESLDVRDLTLEPGQKILVTVKASDRYNLGEEPHVGSADRWLLDVVTPKQLLLMLESREIVLRQRFEAIRDETVAMRDSLIRLEFGEIGADPEEESETEESRARAAAVRLLRTQRAVQDARKSSHETLAVAEAFDSIREQLINNRIYTEELRARIDRDIAQPLHAIVETMFPELERRLRELEEVGDDADQGPVAQDAARQQSQKIVLAMQRVLDRMIEMESFNEAVELLRSIIETQSQLRQRTKDQQKQKLRDLLEGP